MWLPKDERTLLAFCCTKVSRGEAPFDLTHHELIEELNSKGIKADTQLVHEALFRLQNRNLLRWTSTLNGNGAGITFYQQGYDLGRKYSTKRGRFELWCKEYLWLIIFLTMVISTLTLLVTILAIGREITV
jgi:hypothetical protein